MPNSRPHLSRMEVLSFFEFDGPVKGSATYLIPREKLIARFGEVEGNKLADNLAAYHPAAGTRITLSIIDRDRPDAYLQATHFGNKTPDGSDLQGWAEGAVAMFEQVKFVPSPSGYKFLVPLKLDPARQRIGEWVLSYAKIEGGPNPYDPQTPPGTDESSIRKVILLWTTEGFDEYVATCWYWG